MLRGCKDSEHFLQCEEESEKKEMIKIKQEQETAPTTKT